MAVDAGTAYVRIKPDFASLNAELARKLNPIANSFGGKFGKALGPVMAQQSKHLRTFATGAKYAAAGGAALAVVVGKDIVSAGMKFEKQMSVNAAISEANRKQMARLERQSIKLGKATFYSASEAAEAQGELIKGGLSIQQVLGGGLPAALALAEAGQLDLATAAETTVNAMKLFGLQGKEAGMVSDELATAANRTTADVLDFAMALKQGGSVAKLAGLDFTETVTVLESLAEAGIKNSDAGTSLKSFFVNIGTPSKKAKKMMDELGLSIFKQNGELKKLPAIAGNLRKAFGDVSKAQFLEKAGTIAGSDAIRTLYSLYEEGPKKLRALEKANLKQGTAQEIAAKKMDNFAGDLEQLKGSIETAEISIYKGMAPALSVLAEEATKAANRVGSVFEDPSLSGSEKIQKASEVLGEELSRMWEHYHVGDHLIEGLDDFLNDAVPVIAEHAGKLGLEFAKGFVNGFVNADFLGKLVMGAWLLHFIGGKAPFIAIGKTMGRQFGVNFAEQAAATAATSKMATATAGAAVGVGGAGWLGTDSRKEQIRLQEAGMRTTARQTIAHSLAAQGGIFSTLERDITSRWKGLGTRLARGAASWGLGGFVVGEMANEIVGGHTGQELSTAFQSAGVGAAIGNAIAPGIGTALGATLAGAGGLLVEAITEEADEGGDEWAAAFLSKLEKHQPEIVRQIKKMELGSAPHDKVFETDVGPFHGKVGGSGLRKLRSDIAEELDFSKRSGASAEALAALQQKLALVTATIQQGEKAIGDYRHGFDLLRSGVITRLTDIDKVTHDSIASINQVWKNNPPKWHQAMANSMKASIAAIRSGMKQGVIDTETGQKRIQQLTRNLRLFQGRDPLGLADAFAKGWQHAGQINSQQIQAEIRELNKMPKGAREAAREAMVGMAHKLESEGKLVKGAAARLNSALTTKFGQTNKQLEQSTAKAMSHIAQSAAGGATNVGGALKNIFDNLANALAAVGNAKIPHFSLVTLSAASQYHHARETQSGLGQERQRGGFIVPGTGSGDTFRTALPPDTFILNREATRAFGFQRGGSMPVALEPGERVFLPPEAKAIGHANLEAINTAVPRFPFQKGGSLAGEPHLVGPGPLRTVGQQAIHQVYKGAEDYLRRHKPKGGLGSMGASGSVGSHPELQPGISAIVATILKRFPGLAITSTTGGGHAEGSYHYLGRAADLAAGSGYMLDAAGWIKSNLGAELTEGIHNPNLSVKYGHEVPPSFWGSAVWGDHVDHIHVAKQLGGVIRAIHQKLAAGGVVDVVGEVLLRNDLDLLSSAGILGNAWRESRWKTSSVGTGGGGLWGFTTSPISLDDLKAYAASQGTPWTSARTQTQFMLHHLPSSMRSAMNAMGNVEDTTTYFMNEWERPGIPALGERIEGAKKALPMLEGLGGAQAGSGSKEHTYNEDIPAVFKGARTGSLDFPPIPKNLNAVNREMDRWQREAVIYRKAKKAAEKANRPGLAQAIGKNLTAIENHLRQLRDARHKLRVEKAKKTLTKGLKSKLGKIAGYATIIQGAERDYNRSMEYAEQIVDLEPQSPELPPSASDAQREAAEKAYVAQYGSYVQGPEAQAYGTALEKLATWRNTVLRAELFGFGEKRPPVAKMERGWEGKIRAIVAEVDHINDFSERVRKDVATYKKGHPNTSEKDFPKWLKDEIDQRDKLREKLPFLRFEDRELRSTLGEARGFFFSGGDHRIAPPSLPLAGSGSLEDMLIEVQGDQWPKYHNLLPASALAPPRQPGRFGGAIWQLEGTMEELGLKVAQAANSIGGGGGQGEGENEALLKELLTQANQEKLMREIEKRTLESGFQLGGLLSKIPPYAGKAHSGAIVPGPRTQERTMIVKGREGIFTEEQMAALGGAQSTTLVGPVTVNVYEDGSAEAQVGDERIEAVVRRLDSRGARGAGRVRAGRQGSRF